MALQLHNSIPQRRVQIVDSPRVDSNSVRLHGLVVGVNEYPNVSLRRLNGAESDARRVADFLQKLTNVPLSCPWLKTLIGPEATRAAIVEQLDKLISATDIQRGDPIVIFFAGHGGSTPRPKGWPPGYQKIQILLPYDVSFISGGWITEGITDIFLGQKLDEMARNHGNNITVILDCCYSGSGTRPLELIRGTSDELPQPSFTSQDYAWATNFQNTAGCLPGALCSELTSHVLLAACSAEGEAFEGPCDKPDIHGSHGGHFTNELLYCLNERGIQQTYRQLIHGMRELTGQHPQCEGPHADRVLFNIKSRLRGDAVPIRVYASDQHPYYIKMGESSAIAEGFEFTLYENWDSALRRRHPLATLVAAKVTMSETYLDVTVERDCYGEIGNENQEFYVVKINFNCSLPVYIEPRDRSGLMDILTRAVRNISESTAPGMNLRNIQVVDDRDRARLLARLNETRDKILFETALPTHADYQHDSSSAAVPHDFWPLDVEIDVFSPEGKSAEERVEAVLNGATHYDWYLFHRPRLEDVPPWPQLVKFMFLSYTKQLSPPNGQPTPTNLTPAGLEPFKEVFYPPNSFSNDAEFTSEAQLHVTFGFEITNISASDVYVHISYFDHNLHEITSHASVSIANGDPDPCLKPNESFRTPISNSSHRYYRVQEPKRRAVAYYKVYISNHAFELNVDETPVKFREAGMERASLFLQDPSWTIMGVIKLVEKDATCHSGSDPEPRHVARVVS